MKVDRAHLQRVALVSLRHLQDQSRQNVEPLAVTDGLVPAGVGQQNPLQNHPVLLPLLAAVGAAACPVQVLWWRGRR